MEIKIGILLFCCSVVYGQDLPPVLGNVKGPRPKDTQTPSQSEPQQPPTTNFDQSPPRLPGGVQNEGPIHRGPGRGGEKMPYDDQDVPQGSYMNEPPGLGDGIPGDIFIPPNMDYDYPSFQEGPRSPTEGRGRNRPRPKSKEGKRRGKQQRGKKRQGGRGRGPPDYDYGGGSFVKSNVNGRGRDKDQDYFGIDYGDYGDYPDYNMQFGDYSGPPPIPPDYGGFIKSNIGGRPRSEAGDGVGTPPLFTAVPHPEIVFTPGATVTLECAAVGNPNPTYSWIKDDTFIKEIVKKGNLNLDNLSKDNEGVYQCISNNTYGVAVSHRIFLTMATLQQYPQQGNNIQQHMVVEGQPLTLRCPSLNESYPLPQIVWRSQPISPSGIVPEAWQAVQLDEHIVHDVSGQLHFTDVRREDTDRFYGCLALSPFAQPNTTEGGVQAVKLDSNSKPIVELPPEPLFLPDPEMMFLFGEAIHLMCVFGGKPAPEVNWRRVNGTMPKKAMILNNRHELVIENATYYDQGIYECRGSNGAGSVVQTFNVFVESAPYFVGPWRPYIDGLMFTYHELECPVYGVPPVSILWYKDGIPMFPGTETDPYQLIRGQFGERLIFENAIPEMTGVYQCNASNIHGNIFANSYVNILDCAPCPNQHIPVCGSDGESYINECFVSMKNCIEGSKVKLKHCGPCTNDTTVEVFGPPAPPEELHLQSCSYGKRKGPKGEKLAGTVAEIIWSPATGYCVPINFYQIEVFNISQPDSEWEILEDNINPEWFRYTAVLPAAGSYKLRMKAVSDLGISVPSVETAECPGKVNNEAIDFSKPSSNNEVTNNDMRSDKSQTSSKQSDSGSTQSAILSVLVLFLGLFITQL